MSTDDGAHVTMTGIKGQRARTGVRSQATRPLIGEVFTAPDLRDSRVLVYWLVHLSSVATFAFWIVAATAVSRLPNALSVKRVEVAHALVNSNSSAHAAPIVLAPMRVEGNAASLGSRLSADVWFALSLTAAADAIAVVGTFNGAMIRPFHYAVSQRMMFVASAVSYAVLQWYKHEPNLVSSHPLGAIVIGVALYWLFGLVLDRFEKRMPGTGAAPRWGTIQKYSEDLGFVDTSWGRAAFLTLAVSGVGLLLTAFIAPPWSGLVPILHILFESVFLRAVKAKRTARYLVLCSPPFFGTICVHWGVAPVATNPALSMAPLGFLFLVVAGRLLLDLHVWTTFRPRPELQWARREVVISTRKLLALCATMLVLEKAGIKLVTYIKPIMVVAIFGLNGAGFLAVASYNVAFQDATRGTALEKRVVASGKIED